MNAIVKFALIVFLKKYYYLTSAKFITMSVLSGIGSILIIVVAYVILKSSNGWTSGGLIIILPLMMVNAMDSDTFV